MRRRDFLKNCCLGLAGSCLTLVATVGQPAKTAECGEKMVSISCVNVNILHYLGKSGFDGYRKAEDDFYVRGMLVECKAKGWKVLREERRDLGKSVIPTYDGSRNYVASTTEITLYVNKGVSRS